MPRKGQTVHPFVREMAREAEAGRISRRDFLRYAGLLGVSAAAAGALFGPAQVLAGTEAGLVHKVEPLSDESPFEIKDLLIKKAEDACARAQKAGESRRFINAGRGNPDFLNTTARKALALLTLFAALAAEEHGETRDLGLRISQKGLSNRLDAFLRGNADAPGAAFLKSAMDHARMNLGMDPDQAAFEIIDAAQGDFYPDPPRILPVTEKIVSEYLNKVLFAGSPPKGRFRLFATEGATAAMVYIFYSLKINKLLAPGDFVAILTPIFTPYLEMPVLKEFGLVNVNVQGDERSGWQIPDSELTKLRDTRIKALFLVNPTNPTSVSLDQDSVSKIARTIRDHNPDCLVVSDTVYSGFVESFFSLCSELPKNVLGVYSFSKYFGVTGWRLGVVMVHEDCVADRLISRLPARDQAGLDFRYRLTSTTPWEIKFIDRLEIDSRDVALAHTGGLSGPQQAAMCLFALFEILDPENEYKKSVTGLLKRRWEALYGALGLTPPEGPQRTRYYALLDLLQLAEAGHGKDFAQALAKQDPLNFLFRLAEEHSMVCLPGQGFAGPRWSIRVCLANVAEKDCAAIGKAVSALLDDYARG
ncbi:MAG: bifunctional aspartate transaminase/aspartate 4-decarboxylase [Desulfovibrionaceae bacterium]|nr:bifunctional aspartate transaminase/aspartate 4-decarboxylase [Desulfovibrionaceae bacterium]